MGKETALGVFSQPLAIPDYAFYNGVDMRTVFMGTPLFAVPVLKMLLKAADVVGVYGPPDLPRGRGRAKGPSSVKEYALENGLALFQPASLRKPLVQEEFCRLDPELAVVAAYGRIIPSELLRVPRYGFVNVHPSLLPRYRGPSPVVTAILDNAQTTGVSLILLSERLDGGPILAQRSTPIGSDEMVQPLTLRLFHMGAELLGETLPLWTGGQLTPTLQDSAQATYTRKITREDGRIQWDAPAEHLHRMLRAFTPWPGLYTHWQGKGLKLLDVLPLEGGARKHPGSVVSTSCQGVGVGVATGSGLLGIKTLQLEGRQPVSIQEFIQGYPDFLGSRLPS